MNNADATPVAGEVLTTESAIFYAVKAAIDRAMQDERDGHLMGSIVAAGCEAREYDDPEYAANSFIWGAAEAAILAGAARPSPATPVLHPSSGGDQGFTTPNIGSVPDMDKAVVAGQWQPIETAPIAACVLVYWPKVAIDEDGELTGETLDGYGHVSSSVRHSESHSWEPDSVVEANGDWFGDDFEFGQPTHWMPLPAAPAAAPSTCGTEPLGAVNQTTQAQQVQS